MSLLPYRNIVGALIFAAVTTRIDIAYAVNKCAQFMANPGKNHWNALINILVYLRTYPDLVIKFSRPTDPTYLNALSFFVDSDHGGDVDTSRSTTGFVGLFNNGPVSYSSKRQKIASGSGTAQSEYRAIYYCSQEAIYNRQLVEDLGFPPRYPTIYVKTINHQ